MFQNYTYLEGVGKNKTKKSDILRGVSMQLWVFKEALLRPARGTSANWREDKRKNLKNKNKD